MVSCLIVRSTLEYGAVIWDPFTQNKIDQIERLQRKAARFITNDYHYRESSSMTNMVKKPRYANFAAKKKGTTFDIFVQYC